MKTVPATAITDDAPAFTRAELLVVLACLAVLAAMVFPTQANTKSQTRNLFCTDNLRQLMRASLMYVADNHDAFVPAYHGAMMQYPEPDGPSITWASGWLDWGNRSDNTNVLYLTDRRYAKLAGYLAYNKYVFKCPADVYLSASQQSLGWKQRVRSLAGNILVGAGNAETGPMDLSAFSHPTKITQLTNPKPAETWMFLDEHPDSMNDPAFFPPGRTSWIDLPAAYHDGAGGIAFADGHAEMHRWVASVRLVPVAMNAYGGTSANPNDKDLRWLRHRSPRLPGNNE